MKEEAKNLLADFQKFGFHTENLYERFIELTQSQEGIYKFVSTFLEVIPRNTTLFDDALSYITEEHFEKLISQALDILQKGENENATQVIYYASEQFPELLHKHLEIIFDLHIEYYSEYPWRNLPKEEIKIFQQKYVDSNTSLADKQALFKCLIATRDCETIQLAYDYALENKLFDKNYSIAYTDLESWLLMYIEEVGFTLKEGKITSYCLDNVKHFVFPQNYFPQKQEEPIWIRKHPTWHLQARQGTYKFGGVLEDSTENPFFHIITFEPIPSFVQVTGLEKLVLGVHLREATQTGIYFYQHDLQGYPVRLHALHEQGGILWHDDPIQETNIQLADTPNRWRFQNWGGSNGRQNLFRLGGEPTWIQNPEIPFCPICHEKMDFLMQLDSFLPTTIDSELLFGSGGICYIFWCDKTKVSAYVIQCT